ncbi:outer membrane beta-barrel protein [Winogradskyella sp. MH6]|uniref:outer membrane beta-barrel protein n=1 Tax=Winogradskyella sp. MH6 TaxID=2929510 RepID=UPI001FB3EAC4|nr:hypothetical protein [Winogradskyella sp. MH6]
MKKLFLAAFAVFAFASVNAQEFKVGLNAGIPVGDADTAYSFNIQLDVAALWEVSDAFDAGVTAGYSNTSLKSEYKDFGDSAGFIPIAATGRYAVSDDFTLGADLGYALGVNEGNDGGFYYRPRASYSVSEPLDVVLAFSNVSADGFTFSALTLGVEYGF